MNSCIKYKHYINAIFLSVYVFAAFFSSSFHQHQHLNHEVNFAKKVFQKGKLNQEFVDCYSCHLLHSNFTTKPPVFFIEFLNFEEFRRCFVFMTYSIFDVQLPPYNSRGPPVSISI